MTMVDLCFVDADSETADRLRAALASAGHTVRLVRAADFAAGDDNVPLTVILWSRDADRAEATSDMVAHALRAWGNGRLLLARLDGAELPLGLRDLDNVGLSRGNDRDLVDAVNIRSLEQSPRTRLKPVLVAALAGAVLMMGAIAFFAEFRTAQSPPADYAEAPQQDGGDTVGDSPDDTSGGEDTAPGSSNGGGMVADTEDPTDTSDKVQDEPDYGAAPEEDGTAGTDSGSNQAADEGGFGQTPDTAADQTDDGGGSGFGADGTEGADGAEDVVGADDGGAADDHATVETPSVPDAAEPLPEPTPEPPDTQPSTPAAEPDATAWVLIAAAAIIVVLAIALFVVYRRRPDARAHAEAGFLAPAGSTGEAAPVAEDCEVFVSYSRKDANLVKGLVEAIEAQGFSVWIDTRGIGGEARYARQIVSAIRTARAVAVMCSDNAFRSDHVIREVYFAGDHRKFFIAVQLDGTDIPDELNYFLTGFPRLPAADPTAIGEQVRALLQA